MQHPEAREKAAAAAIARADFERLPEAVLAKALAGAEYRQHTRGGKGGSTEDPEEPPRASGSATGSGGKGGGTEDPKGRSDHVVGRSEGGSKQKWCDYPIDLEDNAEVDDNAKSSDDDMKTMKDVSEGSSRMSKSRLSATRGPARANKRREGMMEYAKAKALAEGREWKEVVPHSEHKKKVMLELLPEEARSAIGVEGAAAAIEEVLDQMAEMRFTKEELMQYFFDCSEYFAPKWITEPSHDLMDAARQRYISLKDGSEYCNLCDKFSNWNHEHSVEHTRRLKETAAGDLLIGTCHPKSARRFSNGAGLPSSLSQELMLAYWGSDLEKMPQLVWERLRSGCYFKGMLPGWGKSGKYLKLTDVSNIELAAVQYAGQGKYSPTDPCVLWDQIPKDATMKLHGLPDGNKEKGWWPVCAISWHSEALDMSFHGGNNAYITLKGAGGTITWVICWYQLFDGEWELVLWGVFVRPTSRL